MKIKTLLIYFCIFVNATLLAATPPEYWSDVATKKPDYCSSCNYYKITTPEELAYLSSTPISGTFYIANDLDMSGKLWKPITTKGDLFIYGGGHTISNLTI